ncbi:hypothetical protein ACHAQJ_005576 [Trichoderma viride]
MAPKLQAYFTEESNPAKVSYSYNTVTWGGDGQTQRVDGIHLDVYLDTLTNTAFFKLHCSILFKGSKSSGKMQPLFIFIRPESIKSITSSEPALNASLPGCQSLSFSLARHASLVIPRTDIVAPKPTNKIIMSSMQALASTTDFTVHISACNLTAPKQAHLELVARTFSPTSNNRPLAEERYANVDSFDAGGGGEVANANMATAETCTIGADPSSLYKEPARSHRSNKRRRRDSDIENGQSLTAHEDVLSRRVRTCPSDIEIRNSAHLEALCTRLDHIESRLARLEHNVANALSVGYTCLYGTEERTKALGMLNDHLGGFISGIKAESEVLYKCIENEADEAAQRREDEVNERIKHWREVIEN